jgi:hypothetical protein
MCSVRNNPEPYDNLILVAKQQGANQGAFDASIRKYCNCLHRMVPFQGQRCEIYVVQGSVMLVFGCVEGANFNEQGQDFEAIT